MQLKLDLPQRLQATIFKIKFEIFFTELTDSLSKANEMYENFIVMGDCNIDIGLSPGKHNKLEEFFALLNLPTCFTSNYKSIIPLILTRKLNSFQKNGATLK